MFRIECSPWKWLGFRHTRITAAALISLLLLSGTPLAGEREEASFRFDYAGAITELPPNATARIWIPLAHNTTHQFVKREVIEPKEFSIHVEQEFGNELLYFEAKADQHGEIAFRIAYEVKRIAVTTDNRPAATAHQKELFLKPSEMVPTDTNLVARLLGPDAKRLEIDAPRALYDAIGEHMRYSKPEGQGWGRGDAVWACDSRFGNCTDFHSLFIASARALDLPARFEMGFPVGPTSGPVGGYHCWAAFAKDDRWVHVDISEADKHPELKERLFGSLPPDRVAFTVGRDLQLVPRPTAKSVNFLIYPFVEVGGKPHTKLEKAFAVEHLE